MADKKLLRRFVEYCINADRTGSYFSFCAVAQDMSATEAREQVIDDFLEHDRTGGWARWVSCTGRGNDSGGGCSRRWRVVRENVIDTNPGCLPRRKTYGVICPECGIMTDLNDDDWPADLRREFEQTMRRIYG
jgi:hypothetical protein